MEKWQLLSSNNILASKWLSVFSNSYKLPNGKVVEDYLHLNRSDYVLIVAHEGTKLLVERQYRRGTDDFVYELPAGWIDVGESIEHAALRELREETSYIGVPKLLGKLYVQPRFSSMLAYVVEVTLTDKTLSTELSMDEEIEYELVDISKVKEHILKNTYQDMGMLSALMLWEQHQ